MPCPYSAFYAAMTGKPEQTAKPSAETTQIVSSANLGRHSETKNQANLFAPPGDMYRPERSEHLSVPINPIRFNGH